MSTNKTQNYALHAWLPTDDFQLSEVNQNFAKLDDILHGRIVTGTYTGSGSSQRIDLGGKPLSVHIEQLDGFRGSSSGSVTGGLYFQSPKATYVQLDESGFTVKSSGTTVSINSSGKLYTYLAVMDNA